MPSSDFWPNEGWKSKKPSESTHTPQEGAELGQLWRIQLWRLEARSTSSVRKSENEDGQQRCHYHDQNPPCFLLQLGLQDQHLHQEFEAKERQSDGSLARWVMVRRLLSSIVGCWVVPGLLTRKVRIEEEYQNRRSYCEGRGGFEQEEKATVTEQARKTRSGRGGCARVSEWEQKVKITAIGGKKVVAISLVLFLFYIYK